MKKTLFLILLPLLISCGAQKTSVDALPSYEPKNTETSENSATAATSETESADALTTESKENNETSADSDYITSGTYSLTYEDIDDTQQSKYLNEFDFSADGIDYHGDYLQRGHGDYDGFIQMKKEVSYFYNLTPIKGNLTLAIKANVTSYGDFTATPTIYLGLDSNPDTSSDWENKEQSGNVIEYKVTVNGYFAIKDESSYAMYVSEMKIVCE